MIKKTTQITITTEYITLGQFLKFADIIGNGGEAKSFLTTKELELLPYAPFILTMEWYLTN